MIRMDPHPNSGLDVEIDARTKKLWKAIYLYHSVLRGEQGRPLQQEKETDWLGVFTVAEDRRRCKGA